MPKSRSTDLGLPCPACGTSIYRAVDGAWNTWECVECLVWSTIRDSQMEIQARENAGDQRTIFDEQIDKEGIVSEPEWHVVNRTFCNLIRSTRKIMS